MIRRWWAARRARAREVNELLARLDALSPSRLDRGLVKV